jgi:hypothetical protein
MHRTISGQPGTTQRPDAAREATTTTLRVTARLLSVLWAAIAAFGVIGDVLTTTPHESPATRAVMIAVGVLLISTLAAIPWRWERAGGVLLLVAAVVPTAGGALLVSGGEIGAGSWLFAFFFFGLVPLAAGVLFLVCAHRARLRSKTR